MFQENAKEGQANQLRLKGITDEYFFLNYLFDFPVINSTAPAESTLEALSKIPNAEKTLAKLLDHPHGFVLESKITVPKLSYWDFDKEIQLISFLFYSGAVTYAAFDEDYGIFGGCLVKIPNKCAELEYINKLKDKLHSKDNFKWDEELYTFFKTNNIKLILKLVEAFLYDNCKAYDMVHNSEESLDWSLYILLKVYLGDQIERQTLLKQNKDFRNFYDDLTIIPKAFPNKIFVIEEKNIFFKNMLTGLKDYCLKEKIQNLNFDTNNWDTLLLNYRYLFYDKAITEKDLEKLEIEVFDQTTKSMKTTTYLDFLIKAKKQVNDYGFMIENDQRFVGRKEVIKYVVVRCGPSKLFVYEVKG